MSKSPGRKLSLSQQQDLLNFLSSNAVPVVGNYSLGKTIGEGSFGKVKIGTHKMTGQQVAIKICDKIHAPTLVREIETWRQLRHPNIAQLYEVSCTESKIYMVMEYCKGGEVFEYIERHGRLDDGDEKCKRIFKQIVEAVGYCHEKNFVHRDLKLENILLTHNGDVKLIDFGFTRDYDDNRLLDTYCGSSAYAAPEIIGAKKYSGPEADVWSLGVILFTLVAGYLPFDDESDAMVHKKIMQLDFHLPGFLREDTRDLIMKFLKINPAERISIADTLSHPWFTSCPGLAKTTSSASEPTGKSDEPLITGNNDEFILAAKMEALGFDVAAILESVNSNMCDQNAALWYLLLQRQREFTLTRRVSHSVIQSGRTSTVGSMVFDSSRTSMESLHPSDSQTFPAVSFQTPENGSSPTSGAMDTIMSLSGEGSSPLGNFPDLTTFSSPGSSTTIQLTVDVEKYFADVRRRSSSQSENPIINFASAVPSNTSTASSNSSLAGYHQNIISAVVSPGGYVATSTSSSSPMNMPGSGSSRQTSTSSPTPTLPASGGGISSSPRGRRGIMMETMRANSEGNRRTKNVVGRYGLGASTVQSPSLSSSPGGPTPMGTPMGISSIRKAKAAAAIGNNGPVVGLGIGSASGANGSGELFGGPPIVEGEESVFTPPAPVTRYHRSPAGISEEAENEDFNMEL